MEKELTAKAKETNSHQVRGLRIWVSSSEFNVIKLWNNEREEKTCELCFLKQIFAYGP